MTQPDQATNLSDRMAWSKAKAPDLLEFERLADEAFNALPKTFRALCAGLIIHVADFPSDEIQEAMDCETAFDLLGLFQGCGLAQGEALSVTGQLPNMVWFYRRAILDYWAEHDETLGDIVRHVLVHEIGHHFGLSDEDMDAIEQQTP